MRRGFVRLGVEGLETRENPSSGWDFSGGPGWSFWNDNYIGSALSGMGDGLAMLANAATFHQITPLNDYVTGVVEQGGTLYSVANGFMHVGAYSLEAAGALYVWSVFLPTYGVGIGPGAGVEVSGGRIGVHVIFGAQEPGGAMAWSHAMGGTLCEGGWVFEAGASTVETMWFTVEGLPIISATGVTSMELGVGNCLITAVVAYGRGGCDDTPPELPRTRCGAGVNELDGSPRISGVRLAG